MCINKFPKVCCHDLKPLVQKVLLNLHIFSWISQGYNLHVNSREIPGTLKSEPLMYKNLGNACDTVVRLQCYLRLGTCGHNNFQRLYSVKGDWLFKTQ